MRRLWLLWVLPALFAVACGEPPAKEMDQAQAALDLARAGGAQQFAGEEFAAAVTALSHSREAVTQRDYRLALNHALDSREHAQTATRLAEEARSALRAEVEQALGALNAQLTAAKARLLAAPKAGVSARIVRRTTRTVSTLETELQEVNSLVKAADYTNARARIESLRTRLASAVVAVSPTAGQARGRRRPS